MNRNWTTAAKFFIPLIFTMVSSWYISGFFIYTFGPIPGVILAIAFAFALGAGTGKFIAMWTEGNENDYIRAHPRKRS